MDSPSSRDGGYTTAGVRISCPVEECTLKVDTHIVSGDSVTLGAHKKTLAFFEDFLSPQDPKSDDNIIHLEEEVEVLQILLRFMHNARQPDLNLIPLSQLFSLAEAAEKYLIYSAMDNCITQMGMCMYQDPIGVWIHAVKYDYIPLANRAAYLTLDSLPSEVFSRAKEHELKDISVLQWLRYREQWSLMFMLVLKKAGGCEHWASFQFGIACDIGGQLSNLTGFDTIAERHRRKLTSSCSCYFDEGIWSEGISKKIQGLMDYSDCNVDSED